MSASRAFRLRAGLAAGILLGVASGATPAASTGAGERLLDDPEVKEFVDAMVSRHGMSRGDVAGLIGDSQVLQNVLDAFARPAESKPWYEYRQIFLTETRIAGGVEFWRANRALLERAEATYGVPAEIIVAIVGVESNYGRRKGSIRVIDALVTLAFRYPKRSDFFRRELEQFLLLLREEPLEAATVSGSYAGAMGVPQFIPSSYRAYAVDFDGDRVRDLLTSVPDAVGSIGNYLARHGWRANGTVAVPAVVAGGDVAEILRLGLKPKTRLDELRAMGVRTEARLPGTVLGALVSFETRGGPPEYWIGLRNFYAITRYNHSRLYAMAVYQLATEILAGYAGKAGG